MNKNRAAQIGIHSFIWLIVLVFPLLFLYGEGERKIIRYLDFSLPVVLLMVVFYTNYFVIITHYLFAKRIGMFFAANFLLFAVCIAILMVSRELYFNAYYANIEALKKLPHKENMKQILLYRDIISMSVTVGLSTAVRMTSQWYVSQAEQKELERLHIESELNNLKNQLNPHFLFNTLNNIYSLIAINQNNAQNAVHQLSNLIRYVLYESDHQNVTLKKDLQFTSNYIKLMSLRLPSHVKLETNLPDPDESVVIAPLLFISLVENAFKHGVSADSPSYISISISLSDPKTLECRVQNSNFSKPSTDISGSGIGLTNLRKRLELLYPQRFTLTIDENADRYLTILKLML